MATSWSNLHTSKIVQHPTPSSSSSYASSGNKSKSTARPRAKLPTQSSTAASATAAGASASAMTLSMAPPRTPMKELDDPLLTSRSSSLAGRKRPRESDGQNTTAAAARAAAARRTKSVGDTGIRQPRPTGGAGGNAKDREAFQRGLIAVFVPKALKDSATKGDTTNYNDLLAHFLPTPTNPSPTLPPLLPLLRAISAHVSLLVPEVHGALVSAIIGLPWALGDERFVKTYVGWAGVLVSAHPAWTKEVVQMASGGLAWQHPTRNDIPISRRTYHARYHLLISHLLSLIPTLPNLLGPILVKRFPHKREVEVVQTTWVRNMCELIGYCPELGARIWGEIVDRMLRIDVEINNNLEEEEDDEDDDDDDIAPLSASITLDPFDLLTSQDVPKQASDEDDLSDDESDVDPGDISSADGDRSDDDQDALDEMKLLNQAEKKRQAVKAMREKLDGMLYHFFRHLEDCMSATRGERLQSAAEMAAEKLSNVTSSGQSTPTSEIHMNFNSSNGHGNGSSTVPAINPQRPAPTPAQSLAHFQTLLNLFSRQILPTSSTQHIPFLLFLCASFSHAHTDLFLGLLVSQALYASTTPSASAAAQPVSQAQRIAATVYIGSVVCRARFVTDESARQVLTYLLAYIDGKLRQSQFTKRIDELPLFYAVCQSVMLIFCFRWRAFTSEKGEREREGETVVGEMELEGEGEGEVEGTGMDDGEGEGEGKWIRDLDILQRAITSDLNPLLGCNTTVVNTFAKVAHFTNFAYCFSIIEANQQSTTRSGSSHSLSTQAQAQVQGQAGQGRQTPAVSRHNSTSTVNGPSNTHTSSYSVPRKARQANIDAGLDSYYPFDPFTLPRSKRYIDRIYRTWGEVSIPLDDDDEEDEEESESESESENDSDEDMDVDKRKMSLPKHASGAGSSWNEARRRLIGNGRGRGGRDDGLSSSLEGMSISPAQSGFLRRA